jgi:hypothetical protein
LTPPAAAGDAGPSAGNQHSTPSSSCSKAASTPAPTRPTNRSYTGKAIVPETRLRASLRREGAVDENDQIGVDGRYEEEEEEEEVEPLDTLNPRRRSRWIPLAEAT